MLGLMTHTRTLLPSGSEGGDQAAPGPAPSGGSMAECEGSTQWAALTASHQPAGTQNAPSLLV